MSISIHELLAVAKESEGVKAVQGDDMLCEKRFAPDTRYVVEADGEVWGSGNISSLFFNKESILRNDRVTEPGNPSLAKTGSCFGRNAPLSPCPDMFSRIGTGKKLKER